MFQWSLHIAHSGDIGALVLYLEDDLHTISMPSIAPYSLINHIPIIFNLRETPRHHEAKLGQPTADILRWSTVFSAV